VVNTPYEHMTYYEQGWSGPPEFDTAIEDLEKEIEKDEAELAEKKKRLDYMLSVDERSKGEKGEETKKEEVTPSLSNNSSKGKR